MHNKGDKNIIIIVSFDGVFWKEVVIEIKQDYEKQWPNKGEENVWILEERTFHTTKNQIHFSRGMCEHMRVKLQKGSASGKRRIDVQQRMSPCLMVAKVSLNFIY